MLQARLSLATLLYIQVDVTSAIVERVISSERRVQEWLCKMSWKGRTAKSVGKDDVSSEACSGISSVEGAFEPSEYYERWQVRSS